MRPTPGGSRRRAACSLGSTRRTPHGRCRKCRRWRSTSTSRSRSSYGCQRSAENNNILLLQFVHASFFQERFSSRALGAEIRQNLRNFSRTKTPLAETTEKQKQSSSGSNLISKIEVCRNFLRLKSAKKSMTKIDNSGHCLLQAMSRKYGNSQKLLM